MPLPALNSLLPWLEILISPPDAGQGQQAAMPSEPMTGHTPNCHAPHGHAGTCDRYEADSVQSGPFSTYVGLLKHNYGINQKPLYAKTLNCMTE